MINRIERGAENLKVGDAVGEKRGGGDKLGESLLGIMYIAFVLKRAILS